MAGIAFSLGLIWLILIIAVDFYLVLLSKKRELFSFTAFYVLLELFLYYITATSADKAIMLTIQYVIIAFIAKYVIYLISFVIIRKINNNVISYIVFLIISAFIGTFITAIIVDLVRPLI